LGLIDNRDELPMQLEWWKRAVFYQIAPISFQDSDGDGKGDLKGILSRLDHLEWLGVNALWLCPIYPSPMLDFGYDISDFCEVGPLFGTLQIFDELLAELKARNIRLILDFVPNHTSSRHPWFIESSASRDNAKHDWYVWAEPSADGGPPNNWLSRFGGSAWEWNETRGQYYYHAFLPEQPDLNWRNPRVRVAMGDVLRFWFRRGVDGFRIDASAVLAEDELFRDDPADPEFDEVKSPPPQRLTRIFTDDRPESLDYLAELRAIAEEFPEKVLAGEVQGKTDRIGHFYGEAEPRLHLPLNFALLDSPWNALALQGAIDAYLNAIPGWPDWVIGGHDKRRIAEKVGEQQARIAAMLLLTLKGTPFFFAGDELGMPSIEIPRDKVQDIFEKRVPGFDLSRDPQRSPMRWDRGPNYGFSSEDPWLPQGGAEPNRNVAALREDESSILWLYKRLIALRHAEPALICGDYVPLRSHNDILMFLRRTAEQAILIALNIAEEPRRLEYRGRGRILLSTALGEMPNYSDGQLLRPAEGMIIKLNPQQGSC
jgi:alpha-glucosidase